MFSNKYRYLLILILAIYSYFNSVFSEVYQYYHITAPVWLLLLVFIFITLCIWEGNRWLQHIIQKWVKADKLIPFLLLFFAAGIILSVLVSFVTIALANNFITHIGSARLNVAQRLSFTYATRINLFMHVINAIVLFVQKYKAKETEAEELKHINAQAQLQVIKNQVNPHFLFNNLNVLSSLVLLDNPDANKFIEEFSKVYRHILSSQREELIPLKTELEYMEPYIFLLNKRFPESIVIEINIPQQLYNFYVLPVALQMLVENAIKHNTASKAKPLHIKIWADKHNNLIVLNNLQPKLPERESTNIGLNNIAQRYNLIANREIEICKDEHSFAVLVPLISDDNENSNYRR